MLVAMTFQARIDQEIQAAMLARETLKRGVLRMLKAALMNSAIEKHGAGGALDDQDAIVIVRREIKKRQDSIEGFEKGGRPAMAENERAELEILSVFLPAEEVSALVSEAIAEAGATSRQQMGAVMKIVNAKAAGRIDGRTLSSEVQKQLPG